MNEDFPATALYMKVKERRKRK